MALPVLQCKSQCEEVANICAPYLLQAGMQGNNKQQPPVNNSKKSKSRKERSLIKVGIRVHGSELEQKIQNQLT